MVTRLELDEAANQVKIALAEREVAIERLRQEVRNLINQQDLSGRLIERLPGLAAHMPEIHSLNVLQSGPGDGAFDGLALFLSQDGGARRDASASLSKPNKEPEA